MNRSRLAIIIGVAAVVLGIGVAVVANQGSSGNGAAADTPTATTDTVSVSGTGTVEGVPDTLVANLRVHTTQSTVQEALNTNSVNAQKVIHTLQTHHVARSDIKTTDLNLNQHYDSHGDPAGYDASESINVRIHPLSKVGEILTAASTSAGDSVSVGSLSFDIADNSTLLASAREAAFTNAKAAAQQYATLGGTSLGHVVTIKAQVHNASPIYKGIAHADSAASFGAARAAVPIRPGQKKISVTVKVVWALST
jgi:hypothetical protein